MGSLSLTFSRAGLLMWTVVLLYVPVSISSISVCAAVGIPSVLANKSLSIGVFDVLYTRGVALCARECKYRKRCLSFNYYTNAGECQLNGNTNSSTTLIAESTDGFSYNEINTWPESIAGKCGSRPCPDDSVCVLYNHGYYCTVKYCITPVSPSSDEHVIPEFDHSVSMWRIGTNLKYKCSSSYYPAVDWTCNNNGTWQEPVCKAVNSCRDLNQCNPEYSEGNFVVKYPGTDNDVIVKRLSPSLATHEVVALADNIVFHNKTTTDCDGPSLYHTGKNCDPGCEIPEPGIFQVDLRGTGLKHNPFTLISGQVVFTENEQLVTGTCDSCTVCVFDSIVTLLLPANGTDIDYTNTTIPVCLSRS